MIYEIYFPSESALEACLAELEERSCLLYEEGPDMATEWPLEGNGLAQVYRNDKVLIAYWGDRFKVTEALEAVHGPPIYIYGAIEHKEMDVRAPSFTPMHPHQYTPTLFMNVPPFFTASS